jgi:uncharacterized protein (TIGR03382 family)
VPTTITLQGRGTSQAAQSATLSNAVVNFPATPLMQTSNAQAVTLSNPAGGAPLALGGLTMIGSAAGDFALDSNCGSLLQPGAACVINIRYTPTGGAGTSAATLWVASNARGVVAAELRGTSIALAAPSQAAVALATQAGTATVAPALVASSPVLSFAPVASGTASGDLEVDLTNPSPTAVTLGQLGTGGGDFAIVADRCSGTTLASGATCEVQVRFTPQRAGRQDSTLTASVAGNGGSVAKLSGTGLAASSATSANDGSSTSGGGGAASPWGLLLGVAAMMRRRRRTLGAPDA